MQSNPRGRLVVPVLIIVVGVGRLLGALGICEGIDWVWTLGLGAIGLLAFLVSGLDKVSVVIGPFFLSASVLSALRQTERIRPEVEIPILVIVGGVLLLLAQLPSIPQPRWLAPADSSSGGRQGTGR